MSQDTSMIGIQVTRMLIEARDDQWNGNRIAIAAAAFQTRVESEIVAPITEDGRSRYDGFRGAVCNALGIENDPAIDVIGTLHARLGLPYESPYEAHIAALRSSVAAQPDTQET